MEWIIGIIIVFFLFFRNAGTAPGGTVSGSLTVSPTQPFPSATGGSLGAALGASSQPPSAYSSGGGNPYLQPPPSSPVVVQNSPATLGPVRQRPTAPISITAQPINVGTLTYGAPSAGPVSTAISARVQPENAPSFWSRSSATL